MKVESKTIPPPVPAEIIELKISLTRDEAAALSRLLDWANHTPKALHQAAWDIGVPIRNELFMRYQISSVKEKE